MNIGILISGRGSNMVSIAEAVISGNIPGAKVRVVISDKATAPGLTSAASLGIKATTIERFGRSREEHDKEIISELKNNDVDLVCLAGYMRLVSPLFVSTFEGRIINIHPSLLPQFPGLNAQKQAIEAGVRETGCTVHYVDELLDHGEVILQRKIEVFPDDTEETLSNRLIKLENKTYVEALQQLVNRQN